MHCFQRWDSFLFCSNWPAFDSVKYAHKTKVLGRTIKRREILLYIFLWLCQLNCGYLLWLNRRMKMIKKYWMVEVLTIHNYYLFFLTNGFSLKLLLVRLDVWTLLFTFIWDKVIKKKSFMISMHWTFSYKMAERTKNQEEGTL